MDNRVLEASSTAPAPRARGKRKTAASAPEAIEILFPQGLIGCPTWRRFQLIAHPIEQSGELICLDEPGIGLFIADPQLLRIDFNVELDDDDVEALRLNDASEARIFCILTLHRDPQPGVTANLAGPLVINWHERIGRQVVLDHAAYPLRCPVLAGEAARLFIEALSSAVESGAPPSGAPSQTPVPGEGA